MEDFGVQFAFRDAVRLEVLRALFAELKRDKEIEEFRDPEEWKALLPLEVLATLDRSADEQGAARLAIRSSTPATVGVPEEQGGGPWDFSSVFASLETGEYLLLDVVTTGPGVAELRIEPLAYPYGGLGPFIGLVEAFGFEVLGINRYGRFQPRAELLQGRSEGEERDQG